MMSNATRALCVMLSLIGAAGPVTVAASTTTDAAERLMAAPIGIVVAPIASVRHG